MKTQVPWKFTVQNKAGVILSTFEIPKGMYVCVIARRQPGEQLWANPMSWWGDITIRLQSSDRNKAEKKMLPIRGELREVTVFEDIFQDPLATMSWNDVILVAERPEQ